MANVFNETPDARQSDDVLHPVSRFRPTYRALSDEEKGLHDQIKEQATDLEILISTIPPCREISLSMTKLEECVMWAVKALTGNKP